MTVPPPGHGTPPGHGPAPGYGPAPGQGAEPWGPGMAAPHHRPWAVSQRRRVYPPVILLVLMAALILPLLGLTVFGAGPVPTALGTFFALLPVLPVVGVFLWLDRWEPEPGRLLLTAFLWGAGVSTVAALISSFVLDLAWVAVTGVEAGDALGGIVTAPVVEEGFKGLFLLILVLAKRREFDGIVDGIVYAGLVGVGFAFTENILYLGTAFSEDGLQGGLVLFGLRCVLSPFAHPMFTAMTGLAVGAMARSTNPARFLLPVLGYLAAVFLHALWNGSAFLFSGAGFLAFYVVVMVPIFIGLAIIVIWQRKRESRIVATQLPGFVAAGWVWPDEVRLLASLSGRRGWRRAVKARWGGDAANAVRDYQTAVTELAFFADRIARGAVGRDGAQWHGELVTALLAARHNLSTGHPQALATASSSVRPIRSYG
ncbi:PrsW family intramembrane metalloprotease [Actinopolymorpha sp. B17G11]|uniref:PrsW family intramembrane metalloprotease n=1 Tax=Actinopolymorpha sp. B17G11 TaxID=3160861 RepID=UPI0032E4FABF